MLKHEDFINNTIESILIEGLSAISSIDSGIESYPLNDYLLKTIFLQMTGFQEQKFKCIAWDMATEDFDFRKTYLDNLSKKGFSKYKEKNSIYKELITLLDRDEISEIEKKNIVNEAKNIICSIFDESNLQFWNSSTYNEFKNYIEQRIGYTDIAQQKNILSDTCQKVYNKLYNYRNRLAHNTVSYQRNFPKLHDLEDEGFGDSNYFVWFYILIIIDKVLIKLYNEFNQRNISVLYM